MDYTAAIAFLDLYAAENYTPAEHQAFLQWLLTATVAEREAVLETATAQAMHLPRANTADAVLVAKIEAAVDRNEPELVSRPGRVVGIRRYAAAAVIILLVGGGWWFLGHRGGRKAAAPVAVQPMRDVAPGGNSAVLTLASGQKVVLDSTMQDTILTEGNAIVASGGGRLAYTSRSAPVAAVTYNTLSTPQGGQYQLTLPDGTRVWLDAASSITYPTAFTGKERVVEITGQAYFEVVHKSSQPFRVKTGTTEIMDIGTAFNVNAYTDEPAKEYTLLEGAIAVSSGKQRIVLRPGQQVAEGTGGLRTNTGVDTAAVMAWKNGQFVLQGVDLRTLMRQVARWYDVDVVYTGTIPERQFGGSIGRNVNLSTVLAALQQYGITSRLEGKTVTIGH